MSLNARIGTFLLEGWFTKYDVFDMQVSVSALTDKSSSEDEARAAIGKKVLDSLRAGPTWALNPSVHEIWNSHSEESPERAVLEFLRKNGELSTESVDDRKNHSKITFRARILCDNVKEFIGSSKSLTVEDGYVQTAFFKFPLR